MANNIRIDQSHCNYTLSNWLSEEQWTVLFRDPGRASRGLSGNQARLLVIFERYAWPIPDIVAMKGTDLLFVEIDNQIAVAEGSLKRYKAAQLAIISAVQASGSIDVQLENLLLGFCKIGPLKNLEKTYQNYSLDLLAWFDNEKPSLLWL